MKTKPSRGYRYPYALVGFGGDPHFWWMKFFKKGFYHCFIALGNEYEWILIDPLVHFNDVIILKKINIKDFFKSKGYKIVKTTPEIPINRSLNLMPCTCVETVKRFLGIKNRKIITPYQLFCYLTQKKGK